MSENQNQNNSQYFTVDYFIEKFEAIPDEMWLVGDLGKVADGPHCALGHCGVKENVDGNWLDTDEYRGLHKALFPCNEEILYGNIYDINDGNFFYDRSILKTPKSRILAALADAKSRGENKT